MARGSSRVWVIDPTPPTGRQASSSSSRPTTGTSRPPSSAEFPQPPLSQGLTEPFQRAGSQAESGAPGWRSWLRLLAPGLLGPFAAAYHSAGRERIAWIAAGAVPLTLALGLVFFHASFRAWAEVASNGPAIWLTVVCTCVIQAAFAWGLGSAAARRRGSQGQDAPWWREDPRYVAVFGFLFPGLGLRVAGYPRLAAIVVGWLVLGLGGVAILQATPWFWHRLRSDLAAGVSAATFEMVVLIAITLVVTALLVWLVQGLDGARRVARARSSLLAHAMSASLLVALAAFVLAFRPVSVASDLHSVASALDAEGFRVIPLTLCEASVRLDRASPIYPAHAADLLDSLGRHDAAHAHRRAIERRMRDYINVLGVRDGFLRVAYMPGGGPMHPARLEEEPSSWRRTAALYD